MIRVFAQQLADGGPDLEYVRAAAVRAVGVPARARRGAGRAAADAARRLPRLLPHAARAGAGARAAGGAGARSTASSSPTGTASAAAASAARSPCASPSCRWRWPTRSCARWATPTTLCGADPSCLMHLRGRLARLGSPVEVRHLAELLEEGTRGDAARARGQGAVAATAACRRRSRHGTDNMHAHVDGVPGELDDPQGMTRRGARAALGGDRPAAGAARAARRQRRGGGRPGLLRRRRRRGDGLHRRRWPSAAARSWR